jgi:hypothetical protein
MGNKIFTEKPVQICVFVSPQVVKALDKLRMETEGLPNRSEILRRILDKTLGIDQEKP